MSKTDKIRLVGLLQRKFDHDVDADLQEIMQRVFGRGGVSEIVLTLNLRAYCFDWCDVAERWGYHTCPHINLNEI